MSRTFTLADTREGMIVLLSHAVRRHLYRDTADYGNMRSLRCFNVCSAIGDAHVKLLQCCADAATTQHLEEAYRELNETIDRRLGDHAYVHDWLRQKVTRKQWQMGDEFTPRQPKIIAYRRAWVHDMIRTLKAGGDL